MAKNGQNCDPKMRLFSMQLSFFLFLFLSFFPWRVHFQLACFIWSWFRLVTCYQIGGWVPLFLVWPSFRLVPWYQIGGWVPLFLVWPSFRLVPWYQRVVVRLFFVKTRKSICLAPGQYPPAWPGIELVLDPNGHVFQSTAYFNPP